MKRPIIVGFDPGTTVGLAIIDTKGELLFLTSKKAMKRGEMLDKITEIGKPMLVAGDRNPLPKSVEKLASALSCKVFYPNESLSSAEKFMLTQGSVERIKNNHERSALAAAYKAQKAYANLFTRTMRTLDALELTRLYPEVLNKIILEEAENITQAVDSVLSKERGKEKVIEVKKIETPIEWETKRTIERLQGELKRRESDILILKKYNENLKKKLDEANKKIEELKNPKEHVEDERKIKEIEKKDLTIQNLKKLRELELNGYIPVFEVKELKSSLIENLDKTSDIKGRIIMAKNSDNAQILNGYHIRALITNEESNNEILEKIDFPVLNVKDISVEQINDYNAVEAKLFEEKVKYAKKTGLVAWLKAHKERKL